jgi:formylmethanofuran dehydrogenase subunit E
MDKVILTSGKERLQPYFDRGPDFHGWLSPGLVIGIFMVDLAKELLGPRELIDAVVETKACIPDAIQLMTKCTHGNGWLVTKDWDKLALTLYDKKARDGVRVFVDPKKVQKYHLIHQWYDNNDSLDKDEVSRQLIDIGREILSWQKVRVTLPRKSRRIFALCSACGEAHRASDGDHCQRCSGSDNYYDTIDGMAEKPAASGTAHMV